jgi:hypothetical protein
VNETKKRGPYKSARSKSFLRTISINQETVDVLTAYGNGKLSIGIRLAAVFIDDLKKQQK